MENNQRRSGRTCLIIAGAIKELLEKGEVTFSDHYHSNHTTTFYRQFIIRVLFDTLSKLLNVPGKNVAEMFEVKYHFIQNNYISGITIKATNKGKFQY
jgi:hypothetical protein